MSWHALDWGILGPALGAGLLVLATHVPLGAQVLDRGIVFIDLAIAQIAGLGVIAADAVGLPEGGLAVQAAAVTAALLGAWLLTWTERRAAQQQEALIGVMFILAACASLLLLAGNPHGGEHLKDLLVGQILWVNTTQLAWLGALSAVLLAAIASGGVGRLGRYGFYGVFALAVTASVQLVGVYLVFSSLIVPALATRALRGPRRIAVAYGLGAAGYALGLALSADFRVASPESRFWANFARLGFHHGFGMTVTLPAAVGEQATRDLLYTGRQVRGEEEVALGLCDRIVPSEQIRAEAHALAAEIAASAPLAVRSIRQQPIPRDKHCHDPALADVFGSNWFESAGSFGPIRALGCPGKIDQLFSGLPIASNERQEGVRALSCWHDRLSA